MVHKIRFGSVVVTAVAVGLAIVSLGDEKSPCVTDDSGIASDVRLKKENYMPLEPVIVHMTYTNKSTDRLKVRASPFSSVIAFTYNDEPGTPTLFGRIHGPFAVLHAGSAKTLTIGPGDVVDQRINLNQICDLTLPGNYSVVIATAFHRVRDAAAWPNNTIVVRSNISFVVEPGDPLISDREDSDSIPINGTRVRTLKTDKAANRDWWNRSRSNCVP